MVNIYCFKTIDNNHKVDFETEKHLLFYITKPKVNKMKTTYTIMAIIVSVLFTQTAAAKLGSNRSTMQFESTIGINIETEIVDNINMMLENVQAPAIKTDVIKQLGIETLQSQTNELVQNVNENLPGFKFKVVIAD